MRITPLSLCGAFFLVACAGAPKASDTTPDGTSRESDSQEFETSKSSTAGSAHGATTSKIKATKTEAAMKFFVVDKTDNSAVEGIVISLQAPDGKKYYTGETDSVGYSEVLVPVGQTYELVYLSLGQKDITAKVKVVDEPMQNIKLTLRFKRWVDDRLVAAQPSEDPESEPVPEPQPVFRLDGVNFDSGSFALLAESFPRLDSVVEYMTYKTSAQIVISGHTDNVGRSAKNKALSQKRADACRDYLVEKGIEGSRIEAIGYGDEQPVASNDSEEGRGKNRRIEASEL